MIFIPKHHDLKCVQPHFDAIYGDLKRFEVRKNDRDFQRADRLHVRLWDPVVGSFANCGRSGVVTYVLPGGDYGIAPDHVVMSVDWGERWGRGGAHVHRCPICEQSYICHGACEFSWPQKLRVPEGEPMVCAESRCRRGEAPVRVGGREGIVTTARELRLPSRVYKALGLSATGGVSFVVRKGEDSGVVEMMADETFLARAGISGDEEPQ